MKLLREAYEDINEINTDSYNELTKWCNENKDIKEFVQRALDSSCYDWEEIESHPKYHYACLAIKIILNAVNMPIDFNSCNDVQSLMNLRDFIGYYILDDGFLKISIDESAKDIYDMIIVTHDDYEGSQDIKKMLKISEVFADIVVKRSKHMK